MAVNKILTYRELGIELRKLRREKKKIISTNGVFDILHIGHISLISKAKKLGDVLIVLLNSDKSTKRLKGDKRPINKEKDRANLVSALEDVDYVFIFKEDDPRKILNIIKPSVHVKASDYRLSKIVEKEVVERNGGKVTLVPLKKGYSTTTLLNRLIK